MKAPPSHRRSLSPEAQHCDDIERVVELDFVRATEAALHSMPWLGRGEKELAGQAAGDAIRGMFDLVNISGCLLRLSDNRPPATANWQPSAFHARFHFRPANAGGPHGIEWTRRGADSRPAQL